MDRLAASVRAAIAAEGIDPLVTRTKIPRATLYTLAKGATPSVKTLRRLKAGGFAIPRDLLGAA